MKTKIKNQDSKSESVEGTASPNDLDANLSAEIFPEVKTNRKMSKFGKRSRLLFLVAFLVTVPLFSGCEVMVPLLVGAMIEDALTTPTPPPPPAYPIGRPVRPPYHHHPGLPPQARHHHPPYRSR